MSAALRTDLFLVRRAAHLRARGLDWPQIADALGVPPAAVEPLPLLAPEAWADAFAHGLQLVQAEAFAACLNMLTERMQSDDPKAGMAAAELLVKVHTASLRHRGRGETQTPHPSPADAVADLPLTGGSEKGKPLDAERTTRAAFFTSPREGEVGSGSGATEPGGGSAQPTPYPSPAVAAADLPHKWGGVKTASAPPALPRGKPVSFATLHKSTLTAFLKPGG